MITKEIKIAILDAIKADIESRNFGMLANYRRNAQTSQIMWRNKIRIHESKITMNDTQIATIQRRYSSVKRNGMYKELTPTINYI